jgi:hypothetical protein
MFSIINLDIFLTRIFSELKILVCCSSNDQQTKPDEAVTETVDTENQTTPTKPDGSEKLEESKEEVKEVRPPSGFLVDVKEIEHGISNLLDVLIYLVDH